MEVFRGQGIRTFEIENLYTNELKMWPSGIEVDIVFDEILKKYKITPKNWVKKSALAQNAAKAFCLDTEKKLVTHLFLGRDPLSVQRFLAIRTRARIVIKSGVTASEWNDIFGAEAEE